MLDVQMEPQIIRFSKLEIGQLFSFDEDLALFPTGVCTKLPKVDDRSYYRFLVVANGMASPSRPTEMLKGFDPEVVAYNLRDSSVR